MTAETTIRYALDDDLAAITDIYNHYVINTPTTFDMAPFTAEQRVPWFQQFAPDTRHQLLVLEIDGAVMGYTSSGPLRPKQAYETSVETSVYLHPDVTGNGYGKQLYAVLLKKIEQQDLDVHRCYGIITLPNEPSVALHKSFGFTEVGQLHEVGRKFDRYWDTLWMERPVNAE